MPSGPGEAYPGSAIANWIQGLVQGIKNIVMTDQNPFVVIVIDESGLQGFISCAHTYDTGFFVEQ